MVSKKMSVMEPLASTHGTEGIAETVKWPCKLIIFSIGHFEGSTEVTLKSSQKAVSDWSISVW